MDGDRRLFPEVETAGRGNLLAEGVFMGDCVVVDRDEVLAREKILNSIRGKSFNTLYRWFLWDSNDISETQLWENSRVLLEEGYALFYDGEGGLRFRLPLDRVMFRAREDHIVFAWFDEELECIYHTLELQVSPF